MILAGGQPRRVVGNLPESSTLDLRDEEIRSPKSLSTFTPGFEEGRRDFPALKGTGKKCFSSLYYAPGTAILLNREESKA